MRLTPFTLPIALLVGAACTGSIPDSNPGDPDAAPPDPPGGALMVTVSGTTIDYFDGLTPMAATTVAVEDVIPAVNNTSDTLGAYSLLIPPGSTAYAVATRSGYRPTRNVPLVTETPDIPVTENLYVASVAETANLYNNATDGLVATPIDMTPATAVIMTDLRKNNGTPLVGVTLADISLVDLAVPPAPVIGIAGPYFLDLNGQIDMAITTGVEVNGRIRAAILNCPPGNYNLLVNYIDGQLNPQTYTVPVTCGIDGFTLTRTGGLAGGGGGGGGGGGLPANPTFAIDVYPRLQNPAVSAVGRACQGCHNTLRLAPAGAQCIANPASCVPWAVNLATPAEVHAALLALPGVIVPPPDVATSLFLMKPLRELVGLQNHPNVTFLTDQDNDYKLFMRWIEQGAVL